MNSPLDGLSVDPRQEKGLSAVHGKGVCRAEEKRAEAGISWGRPQVGAGRVQRQPVCRMGICPWVGKVGLDVYM